MQHIAKNFKYRPEYLYIILEGKYAGRNVEYHDAVLHLDKHLAIIVENEMSATFAEHLIQHRIQTTLNSSRGVAYNNNGGTLKVNRAHTKYAVQLHLAKNGDSDGMGVLWWLAQGDRGAPILPSSAFRRPHVMKNWNISIGDVRDSTVQCRYNLQSGEVSARHEPSARHVKVTQPMCHTGLAAVHAPARFTNDDAATAGICALCGVPIARVETCLSELDLIAATEGEPTRDPLCRRAYTATVAGFGPSVLCAQCGRACAKLQPYVDAGTRAWKTVLGVQEDNNSTNATKIARQLFPKSIPFIERLSVCMDVREDTGNRRQFAIVLAQCPFENLRSVYVPKAHRRLKELDIQNDIHEAPFEETPLNGTSDAPFTDLQELENNFNQTQTYIESFPCSAAMTPSGSGMDKHFTEYTTRDAKVYQAAAILYTTEAETWKKPPPNDRITDLLSVGLRVRRTSKPSDVMYIEKIVKNRTNNIMSVKISAVGSIARQDQAPAQNTRSQVSNVLPETTESIPLKVFMKDYELHEKTKDVGHLYKLYRDNVDAQQRILSAKEAHNHFGKLYEAQNKSVHVLFVKIDNLRDTYALPRSGTLKHVLISLWKPNHQTTHSVAMQLRALGHLAFRYVQPHLEYTWRLNNEDLLCNNFLYFVWDLYVAQQAAKRDHDAAFKEILAHIFPQYNPSSVAPQVPAQGHKEPREHVKDVLHQLEMSLGTKGSLYTELIRRADLISGTHAMQLDTIQAPNLTLEARLIGNNATRYDMHARGMRCLLLQTAAGLAKDNVRYDGIERLRDVAPLSKAFDD